MEYYGFRWSVSRKVTFDPFRSFAEALLYERPKPVRTQCRLVEADAPFIRPHPMNKKNKVHFF